MLSRTTKSLAVAGVVLALGATGIALGATAPSLRGAPKAPQSARAYRMSAAHVRAMVRAGMNAGLTRQEAEALVRRCREMMRNGMMGDGAGMMQGGGMMGGGAVMGGGSMMR